MVNGPPVSTLAVLVLFGASFVSVVSLGRVVPQNGELVAPDPTVISFAGKHMSSLRELHRQAVHLRIVATEGNATQSKHSEGTKADKESAHGVEETEEMKQDRMFRWVVVGSAFVSLVLWGVGVPFHMQIFVGYVALYSLVAMLSHATRGGSQNSGMVVLNCLLVKIGLSLGLWRATESSSLMELPGQIWKYRGVFMSYALPAGCYAIGDVIRIQVLRETTPGTYAVLFNLRILFLIPAWQFVMNRKLLPVHWLSLIAILLGCIAKESGNVTFSDEQYFVYTEILLLGCLSALAGVFTEKLLQHNPGAGVSLQNMAMYSWSLLWVSCITMIWSFVDTSRSITISPFAAASWIAIWGEPMVVAQVLVFSLFGISTGYFLRHMTNIAREVALGAFMVVCMAMDILLFNYGVLMVELLGLFLCLFGIILFGFYPVVAAPTPVVKSASSSPTLPKTTVAGGEKVREVHITAIA